MAGDLKPWRRARISLIVATLIAMTGLGVLALSPEYILFRDRLVFSIFDMGSEFVLQPFDYRTHDGLTLRSWYNPPEEERPTIVYFAGRDGDLIRKPAHLLRLAEEGYGLILAGYRGYGGNPGRPSERSMFFDAASLLSQAQHAGLAPNGYILYGYSMGTGIASNAAVQVRPLGLILEAPLSTFGDAVRQQVGRFPNWLVRTHFNNLARIAELDVPVLILAGGRDTVTPPSFALALAAAREATINLHVYDDANHFSIIRLGGREAVYEFLEELEDSSEETESGGAKFATLPRSSASPAPAGEVFVVFK